MKACRDCRWSTTEDPDYPSRQPSCHHPQSFIEISDHYTGTTKTVARSVQMMRMFTDNCGPDAKLFEPREEP
jgi:hypothetical protein